MASTQHTSLYYGEDMGLVEIIVLAWAFHSKKSLATLDIKTWCEHIIIDVEQESRTIYHFELMQVCMNPVIN